MESVDEELNKLQVELAEAEEKVKKFEELIAEAEKLQEPVKATSLKLASSLKQIKSKLKEKKTPSASASVSVSSSSQENALTSSSSQEEISVPGRSLEETKNEIKELEERAQKLRAILPETRSLFSRLFLGRVNLKLWTHAEKDRIRDEYNKFKRRTNYIFVGLPLIVLFTHYYLRHTWKDTHWLNIMYQIWMLYYYFSMALRENILVVNGSNMHWWWIHHHYIAAFGTIIVITWPPTEEYVQFVPQFTWFLLFQGFVQILQVWYQTRRLYANRALGKMQRMDVAYPETITEFPRELLVLIPSIATSHVWQLYLGYSLICMFMKVFDPTVHWTAYTQEVQIFISALVFICLGIGNLIATSQILWKKAKKENERLKHRSKNNSRLNLAGIQGSPHSSRPASPTTSPTNTNHNSETKDPQMTPVTLADGTTGAKKND